MDDLGLGSHQHTGVQISGKSLQPRRAPAFYLHAAPPLKGLLCALWPPGGAAHLSRQRRPAPVFRGDPPQRHTQQSLEMPPGARL